MEGISLHGYSTDSIGSERSILSVSRGGISSKEIASLYGYMGG